MQPLQVRVRVKPGYVGFFKTPSTILIHSQDGESLEETEANKLLKALRDNRILNYTPLGW